MSPLTFELPMPPNQANARMHWRTKSKAKQAYRQTLTLLMYAKRIPPPPASPLTGVTLDSTLHVWSTMDDDNALARIKWAADFLVQAGYLVDDKRPHCRFSIPEQLIDRANQRLVITLTPTETPE